MTHLRFTVPDVRCIVCRKMGAAQVESIYARGNDPTLKAHVRLPDGWVSVSPYNTAPMKALAVCGTCYAALPSINEHQVNIEVENPEPPKE